MSNLFNNGRQAHTRLKARFLNLHVLASILLFGELPFHLLELHGVFLDGLRLLVDLLLEGARDLHHVLVVLVDLLARPPHVLLKALEPVRPLVQPDVQRRYVAIETQHEVKKLNTDARA